MEKRCCVSYLAPCGAIHLVGLDNLDHNPSSTTAKSVYHGTGMSLFQSLTSSNIGYILDGISLQPQQTKNFLLPDNYMYTKIPTVALKKDNVHGGSQTTL